VLPKANLALLYDVSHNTCKTEEHEVNGCRRRLFVHRKGATRAFGPGHPDLPEALRATGQPVLIGGSMGTASYILAGNPGSEALSFSSACHGAGRSMSRRQALKQWSGRQVVAELAARGIEVRSPSPRGVAEEAPGAYKDVDAVVKATERAGLARCVARLEPVRAGQKEPKLSAMGGFAGLAGRRRDVCGALGGAASSERSAWRSWTTGSLARSTGTARSSLGCGALRRAVGRWSTMTGPVRRAERFRGTTDGCTGAVEFSYADVRETMEHTSPSLT